MANPNDFLDYTLRAILPVKIVTGPNRDQFVKDIPAGSVIGTIYSWVKDPSDANNVFWQLYEYQGSGGGFVRNDPARMYAIPPGHSETIVQVPGMLEQLGKGASDFFGGTLGKLAPWILAAILGIAFIRSRK